MDDRKEFLIQMYNQLYNDINRHILVSWQSIVVLTTSLVALVLQEKAFIPMWLSTTIILVIIGWFIAHLYDSSYWYNRNLVIIANIEKQFLEQDDLKLIHYYFGKHRPKNKMISHLELQYYFGLCISVIAMLYHFIVKIWPVLCSISHGSQNFSILDFLPYITALILFFLLREFKFKSDARYYEFLHNSPGKSIITEGIKYGIGHGGKQ